MKDKIKFKKIGTFAALMALLLFFHANLPGIDFIAVLGIAIICVHVWRNFCVWGWISVFLHPITYWIASLCDRPINGVPNNLYVYWSLGYVIFVAGAFAIEMILAKKRSINE